MRNVGCYDDTAMKLTEICILPFFAFVAASFFSLFDESTAHRPRQPNNCDYPTYSNKLQTRPKGHYPARLDLKWFSSKQHRSEASPKSLKKVRTNPSSRFWVQRKQCESSFPNRPVCHYFANLQKVRKRQYLPV